MRNKILTFIFLFLLIGSVINVQSQEQGSQTTSAQKISASLEEPKQVGDLVLKNGISNSIQISGGSMTIGENKGGTFKVEKQRGNLELNTEKRDLYVQNAAKDSSITLDSDGKITELDLKGVKPDNGEGTKIKISGTHDTEITIPENSEIKKKEQLAIGDKKADSYTIELGNDKVLEKPKRTERKREEQEGMNPFFRFNGMNIRLSDSMAELLGLEKGSYFSGTLVSDPYGNWFTDQNTKFFDSNGKEILKTFNLADKYKNINERTYFFNDNDWRGEAGKLFRESGGGSYLVKGNNFVSVGSTNNKLSPYFEFGEGSIFRNKFGVLADKSSEIYLGKKDSGIDVKFKGDGLYYIGGESAFVKQNENLYYIRNDPLKKIFGDDVDKTGLKFPVPRNYASEVFPLNKDGTLISNQQKQLMVKSRLTESGAVENQVFPSNNPPTSNTQKTTPTIDHNPPNGGSIGKKISDSIKKWLFGGGKGETPTSTPPEKETAPPAPPVEPPKQQPPQPQIPKAITDLISSIRPPSQQVNLFSNKGETISMFGSQGTYKGKGVIIIGSMPNCPPCRELAKKIPGIIPDGVQVITVDITQNPQIAQNFGIDRTPKAVLLDPNTGRATSIATGEAEILNLINSLNR